MGLEHFQQACPAVSTLQDAQVWCVAKAGTCCGVCPNTLASLGTRVGLTVTVFFATLVVVIDGAEAPFIFMTTCLQAVAYLVTVLQAGLTGDGISRFHAYYALLCSMGFLCPLAAASVTATHFSSDRQPAPSSSKHARRPGAQSYRSLGSPFFHSSQRRPLASTDPFRHHEGTSTEASPVVQPIDAVPSRKTRSSYRRASRSPRDEEAAIESPTLLAATPSSLLDQVPPLRRDSHHTLASAPPDEHRSPRGRRTLSLYEPDPTLTALPPLELTPAALPPPPARLRRRLQKRQPAEPIDAARSTSSSDYAPDQLRKIEKKVKDGAWRRWGMMGANAALFLLWLVVFLFLHDIVGSLKFIQTGCDDPNATQLLTVASIALLCFSVVVFGVCALNFYSHVLHYHIRRILDYSRGPRLWTQLAVPALFSSVVFTLWLALLWTSYELAAQPSSSLLAESEQSTTFATVLSIALVVKPVSDLIKALFKLHRRKSRLAKSKLRNRSSRPDPPPSLATSSRPQSPRSDAKEKDLEMRGRSSRNQGRRDQRVDHSRTHAHRPPSPDRSTVSSSGNFSRTTSQAAHSEPTSWEETSGEERRARSRRRRKRVSLRRAVFGQEGGPTA